MRIKCYKGAKANEEISIEVSPEMKLDTIREELISNGFIPKEDTKEQAYRFIVRTTTAKKTSFEDIVIPVDTEKFVPVNAVWGFEKQVILSDIYIGKKEKADYVGFLCKKWFSDFLAVSCKLNMTDKYAIDRNKEIGAFEPMMMYDVIPLFDPNKSSNNLLIPFSNVCVCLEGSVVQFDLTSWGAAGYNYQIYDSAGHYIVDDLYHTFRQEKDLENGSYGNSCIRRWQNKGNTIEITGVKNIPGASSESATRLRKITFRSRSLRSYMRGDSSFKSSARQPGVQGQILTRSAMSLSITGEERKQELLNASKNIGYLDGDSIMSGAPVEGGQSSQTFGSIHNIEAESWDNPLGFMQVDFFVFKSREEAEQTIKKLNSLDNAFWD